MRHVYGIVQLRRVPSLWEGAKNVSVRQRDGAEMEETGQELRHGLLLPGGRDRVQRDIPHHVGLHAEFRREGMAVWTLPVSIQHLKFFHRTAVWFGVRSNP